MNKLLSSYLISITLKTWSHVPIQICVYPILLPRGHCCCSLKLSGKNIARGENQLLLCYFVVSNGGYALIFTL